MSITRRTFTKSAVLAAAATALPLRAKSSSGAVRLGGPVFGRYEDPAEWAEAHRALGYAAAYCPVQFNDPAELKQAYVRAAAAAGLVIAEVGAWSNPLSRNEEERRQAFQKNVEALALADEIGALCAVNIAGSFGEKWAGIHEQNTSREFFDAVVETVRKIIDAVKPKRTFYTLETMPYTLPDSPESYLELIKAIDRKAFACHLDPVNLINTPRRFYDNAGFVRQCFRLLGRYIKSCHAKDVTMEDKALVHLDEVRPGLGRLNYRVLLRELAALPNAVPLMIEHLQTAEEYKAAADYIRSEGEAAGVRFL